MGLRVVCICEKGYDINVQGFCLSFVYDMQQRAPMKVVKLKIQTRELSTSRLTVAGFVNDKELVLFDR